MTVNSENKIEAFKSVEGIIKNLITLSTGTIVFSGTISTKNNVSLAFSPWLLASWVCLILSVILGIIANGQIATQLSKEDYNIFHPGILWPERAQQVFFVIGIILLGIHFLV